MFVEPNSARHCSGPWRESRVGRHDPCSPEARGLGVGTGDMLHITQANFMVETVIGAVMKGVGKGAWGGRADYFRLDDDRLPLWMPSRSQL